MAEIIDGKKIAHDINSAVKNRISEILLSGGKPPKLVSVSAGKAEGSKIYSGMQKKASEEVGIKFVSVEFGDVSENTLAKEIKNLYEDETVTAIIIQNPLPGGINHSRIVSGIIPEKDAEGIHPYNLGKILRREADIVPCTPGAVMKILSIKGIDLYGKEVVIIGHSAIVGKPLSLMMLNETATTTVCHIGTSKKGDLRAHARRADVLVVAVGNAEMVKGDWIKKGAVVIDVGINRTETGGITGDVDQAEAGKIASIITPVPGGVGPVTVSILMRNVLRAYERQHVKI